MLMNSLCESRFKKDKDRREDTTDASRGNARILEMPSTQISDVLRGVRVFSNSFLFFPYLFLFNGIRTRSKKFFLRSPCVNAFQAKIEELHRSSLKFAKIVLMELGCCLQFDHDFFRKEISDSLAM